MATAVVKLSKLCYNQKVVNQLVIRVLLPDKHQFKGIMKSLKNLLMLFNSAFVRNNVNLNEVRDWMREAFEKVYNDLSEKTKETFKAHYQQISEIVLGK